MEQVPKTETKEKNRISKIHFLIHPGFMTDSRFKNSFGGEFATLYDSYIEKVSRFGNDELMVAFTYADRKRLRREADLKPEKDYLVIIKQLKSLLGDRFIVLADAGNILNENSARDSFERIKTIANARGYFFDEDVLSEAYGETLMTCVPIGARNLNVAGNLKKKTVIKTGLTEAAPEPENVDNYHIERMKKIIRGDSDKLSGKRLEIE